MESERKKCGKKKGADKRPDSPSSSIPSPTAYASAEDGSTWCDEEPPNKRNCDKYNLRRSSLRVRVQTEQKKQQPKPKRPKSRPPPLSKYRRRTANARERSRMAEINDAFEVLKQALPREGLEDREEASSSSDGHEKSGKSNKSQQTKATVLRLAINYIAALRDVLGYNSGMDSSGSSCGESSRDPGDSSGLDLGSDGASSATPSTSCGSGDEESLMSVDMDAGRRLASDMDTSVLTSGMDTIGIDDLDFFDPSLAADFSPELSPDFTATLSPEEEVCLELVTSVL